MAREPSSVLDLEKGGGAVQPEEPWPDCVDLCCGAGVLLFLLALQIVGVVAILVSYFPWVALLVAAQLGALDYALVLLTRESLKGREDQRAAMAARRTQKTYAF